uniref:ST6 N-acetylgalactosaminide alpha-2,6-sialyltransferase 6 n=2 Tax=Sus scrofa TaxID=9823 RepID=A0A5G2R5F6_PIG
MGPTKGTVALAEGTAQAKWLLASILLEVAGHKYFLPFDRCEPTSLTPGPPAGRWPLPLSRRRRREMSSNKEQRSAVFVILFALITILILYSSNSANEVFHYGSQLGRTRRPVNLKKWSITDGYVPLLGNKGKVPFVVEHRLVHHGDCGGVV